MNYWERWIGDWKRKTSHLSIEKKGAYAELLDHIYATEMPLPTDFDDLCRLTGARTESECASLRYVLENFFTLTPKGYMNKKADEEIAKRHAFVESRRSAAFTRWRGGNGGTPPPAPATKPRQCRYCDKPSLGIVNSIPHCREHTNKALDQELS